MSSLLQLEPLHSSIQFLREFWVVFGPGGKLHPQYFLEHKGHLVVEGLLLLIIAYLFLQQSFKPRPKDEEPLTEKEIDALCREWKPEPLVPKLKENDLPPDRIITGPSDGAYLMVEGKRVLNLASANFLNLGGTKDMLDTASRTIAKYGVGSCGPRGFYGTIDVHLELEEHLARFMGCPLCTIFSFDIATVASVIPACANRKDIIIADESCSYPIQQGMTLSRAAVHYFKHNDMADLEQVLQRVEEKERREKKPLCRKLIVVEGIFANVGDIPPLDKIYAIKEKYKYRLLVEESLSFGVLGPNGRGACEHFGLKTEDVIICASMSCALGSIGGFCVGDPDVVEHQRLAGSGYVFSASLPPFLATSAHQALAQLQQQAQQLLPRLHRTCAALRSQLKKIPGLLVSSGPISSDNSPLIHLRLAPNPSHKGAAMDAEQQARLLRRIADVAFEAHDVLVSVPLYSCLERVQPAPSLRLFVSVAMQDKEVATVVAAIKAAAKEVL